MLLLYYDFWFQLLETFVAAFIFCFDEPISLFLLAV